MDRVLETLVALAGLYLFLSLISMAVVEGFSSLVNLRARHLERGVLALLEGQARAVLNSPVLRSLARASGRGKGLPSYVPREMFTAAVVEMLDRRGAGAVQPAATVAPALDNIVEQSAGDARALRRRIEEWFDAGMERVSGKYKRSVQRVTRVVAILLVVALNADSIEIGQRVWSEPSVREGALMYSQRLIELCRPDEMGRLVCPEVAGSGEQAVVPYPLGWSWPRLHALGDAGDVFNKGIGLLLTILAASLGAPFWFDVLRRVAPGLRQVGPKPKESPSPMAVGPAAVAVAEAPSGARIGLMVAEEPAQQR